MTLILSGTDGLSDIDGTAATPAIRGTDANTGIFFGTDIIGFSEGGVEAARINADSQFVAAAGTAALPVITTTGDTNTGIFFPAADTIAFSEGGAEAMRIDSLGNVGIGTSSPAAKLQADSSSTTYSANIRARNSNFGNGVVGAANGILTVATDMNNLAFYTASNLGVDGTSVPTNERMRIDSSGNLLVGTTATNYSERLKITFPNTQGIHLNESTNSSSVNYQYFTKGSTPTNVGAIYYNGSVMAYQTTSDYRLKENIAPMTGALAKIAALKPVIYTWKDNQRDGEGFIAHELQKHFPDAVSGIKDDVDEDGNPKYQGMDASILIATLTAAMQEQQALITALTDRITALETP